jgi:hypothetical protein
MAAIFDGPVALVTSYQNHPFPEFESSFVLTITAHPCVKKMQENKLFKSHTMQEVLDEFDIIECFEVPGQQLQVGETTKR